MALPFFGKKKLRVPPAPPKQKIKKAVARLGRKKAKVSLGKRDFGPILGSMKNLQASVNAAHKRITEAQKKSENLGDFSLKFKNEFEKFRKKSGEEFWSVRQTVSELSDTVEELKQTEKKDISELGKEQDSKLAKINQTLAELKKTDAALKGWTKFLYSDLKNLESGIKDVLDTFTPATLNKLKSSMEVTKDAIKKLDSKESDVLKEISRITKEVMKIERHSDRVEDENLKTKRLAEDLTKISDELKNNLDEAKTEVMDLKTRFNVAINSASDLEKDKDSMRHRLANVEGRLASLAELQNSITQLQASIAELANRVAEVEKTAVRTFVIQ